MTNTFYIKRNDTSPAFQRTLKDAAGTVIDLTGASVVLHVTTMDDESIINAAAIIVTPLAGLVQYNWLPIDTSIAGTYKVEWEVTYADTTVETFPNDSYDQLIITKDLPKSILIASVINLETGAGIRLANSYITAAYADNYFSVRNRSSENTWSSATKVEKEAACIAATDYIEKRFGHKFQGEPRFAFVGTDAIATITFTGIASNGEIVTIGDETYVFQTALDGITTNEVLIGASAIDCAVNLHAAITADSALDGISYDGVTESNRHVSATILSAVVTLTSIAPGSAGNDTVFSTDVVNATITAFNKGEDAGQQPLSFPRRYLYDRLGNEIDGIPKKLKDAISEYAVRAHASTLDPDPVIDDSASQIKRTKDKVGPIESEIEYVEGTYGRVLIKPYPAADRLLRDFLITGIGVIR
jgi:hypothetical protein